MKSSEDAYIDGYLAGCATGNGYIECVDKELAALRVRVEVLEAACAVERKRAEHAEAQTLKLAMENAEMLTTLRDKIAEGLRLMP